MKIISKSYLSLLIQKGYMVYNGNTLLEIESSTARTIYMLIEKLRFSKLYLILDTIYLIKRIPLKFERKNLPQTIKTLEKAFQELVSKNLIQGFKFIKETTWEKSEVEINFHENANEEKQERFFKDRNDVNKVLSDLTIIETTHNIVTSNPKTEVLKNLNLIENTNRIINLMPKKAKQLKTLPKTIKEAIEEYGYEKVEKVAIYMKKQKVEKIRVYFLKALKENWEIEDSLNPKIEKVELIESNLNTLSHDEFLYKKYELLPDSQKEEIENIVYKDYLKKCGIETKVQRLAFKNSKKIYICEYLEKNIKLLEKADESKDNSDSKCELNIIFEIEDIKKIVIDSIELANLAFLYSDDEKVYILKNILREIIPLTVSKELTLNKLNKIIKEYIKL